MNYYYLIGLLLCFSFVVKSQNLDTETYNKIPRSDINLETSLNDYPYLAVSVLLRQEYLFSDKNFVTKRLKLKYFFAEASVTNAGSTTSVPLYFLQRERGRFSVSMFKDRTIIRKVPVSIYSNSIPVVEINTDIKFKDKAVSIIKAITDKVSPLIDSPTKIFGPGSTNMFFGFMEEVVDQLDDEVAVNASVGFDVFAPEKLAIRPTEYKVIILKPRDEERVDLTRYKLKEINRQLVLTNSAGEIFDKYPYFIIEIGLSNYLSLENIPSQFILSNPICNLNNEKLRLVESTLSSNSNLLTQDQQLAERTLLQYLSNLIKLKNGVAEQNKEKPSEQVMIDAYNAYYEFTNELNHDNINKKLFDDHYKALIEDISVCINSQIRLLSYLPILAKVTSIYNVTDFANVSNSKLGDLYYFIGQAKQVSYIIKSKFYGGIEFRKGLIEDSIYEKYFRSRIGVITNSRNINDSIREIYKELAEYANQYNHCKKCLTEIEVATIKYIELEGAFRQTKEKINENLSTLKAIQNTLDQQMKNLSVLEAAINNISDSLATENSGQKLNKSIRELKLKVDEKMQERSNLLNSLNELFQKNSYLLTDNEKITTESQKVGKLKNDVGGIVNEIKIINSEVNLINPTKQLILLNFSN